MPYKTKILDEAAIRHAKFYITKLTKLNEMYKSTPEDAIPKLRKTMPQLRQAYSWLLINCHTDPSCTALLVKMIAGGMACVRMVVAADEWAQWLQVGVEAATQTQQEMLRLDFLIEQGIHAFRQGDLEEAEILAQVGEKDATALSDFDKRAQSHYLQALVHQKRGKADLAQDAIYKAQSDYEQIDDFAGIGKVRSFLAQAAIDAMDYERAHKLLEQNIRLWDDIGNFRQKAVEQYQLGVMFSNRTMYDESDDYLHDARASFSKLADRRYEAYSLQILSANAMERNLLDSALTYIDDAYDLFIAVNDQRGVAGALNYMGRIYEKQDDYSRAIDVHQQAAEVADAVDYRFALTDAHRSLCEIYLTMDNVALARQNIYQAIKVGETSGNQLLVLAVLAAAVGVFIADERPSIAYDIAATIQATTDEPLILQMLEQHTDTSDLPQGTSLSVDEACELVKNLYQ